LDALDRVGGGGIGQGGSASGSLVVVDSEFTTNNAASIVK
jgi:hypothetical protein